ncbi:MAG: hypothetical protein KDA96_20070, partial [Planctomycetaceae bacterium]|nr:hypothetical protein [Planctomycetaceae bacterium]
MSTPPEFQLVRLINSVRLVRNAELSDQLICFGPSPTADGLHTAESAVVRRPRSFVHDFGVMQMRFKPAVFFQQQTSSGAHPHPFTKRLMHGVLGLAVL